MLALLTDRASSPVSNLATSGAFRSSNVDPRGDYRYVTGKPAAFDSSVIDGCLWRPRVFVLYVLGDGGRRGHGSVTQPVLSRL